MLETGPARKVTLYLGEDQQYHGHALYAAILDFLFYRGVAGANVMRGIAGFGSDHRLHTTRILRLAENLPIKIEFIESSQKVEELLPKLSEMVGSGLIEIRDTHVLKPDRQSAEARPPVPHFKKHAAAKLMRIYISESDRWGDKPLYKAIVECLRANEIAGVTVYHGILGYGANRKLHEDRALSLSHDRPILLSVIDTEEKLHAVMPFLDEMMKQGLVVFSNVDVIKYAHGIPEDTGDKRSGERE